MRYTDTGTLHPDPARDFAHALAHYAAETKPGEATRQAIVDHLLDNFTPAARLRFKAELYACRQAQYGALEAAVA